MNTRENARDGFVRLERDPTLPAQCVILAGGRGERMRPYTEKMPKPMFQIGGKPILWHIMKQYRHYGVRDFVVCVGYKAEKIEEYFEENSDDDWNVEFVNTGVASSKGERLRRVESHIWGDEFYLAYGDDLSDINIAALTDYHRKQGKLATLTAVRLASSFGIIDLSSQGLVRGFKEKPKLDYWINGGFFCLRKGIFELLKEGTDIEKDLLPYLAGRGEIAAFRHEGFWNPINTHKDSLEVLKLWQEGAFPWVTWKSDPEAIEQSSIPRRSPRRAVAKKPDVQSGHG